MSTWPGHHHRPSTGSAACDGGRRSRGTAAGLMDGDAVDAVTVPATGDGDGDDGVAVVDGGVDGSADIRPGPRVSWTMSQRRRRMNHHRRSDVDRPDRPLALCLHRPPGPARPSKWFPGSALATYFSDN